MEKKFVTGQTLILGAFVVPFDKTTGDVVVNVDGDIIDVTIHGTAPNQVVADGLMLTLGDAKRTKSTVHFASADDRLWHVRDVDVLEVFDTVWSDRSFTSRARLKVADATKEEPSPVSGDMKIGDRLLEDCSRGLVFAHLFLTSFLRGAGDQPVSKAMTASSYAKAAVDELEGVDGALDAAAFILGDTPVVEERIGR